MSLSRLLVLCALSAAAAVQAAPHLEGTPRWTEEGAGLSDYGSRYVLQARVSESTEGGSPDTPLRAVVREGASVFEPALLRLSLALEGATGRTLRFHPWGWEEEVALPQGRLRAHVFTARPDVFALVLTLEGGAPARPATLEVAGAARVEAVAESVGAGGTPDAQWWTVPLTPDTPVGFLLTPAADGEARLAEALASLGAPATWLPPVQSDWEAWLARTGGAPEPGADVAEALAVLRHATLTTSGQSLPVRAKGRTPQLALEEVGLLARALAELGDDAAPGLLRTLAAAQAEDGLLPPWLGPQPPPAGATRIPRFLSVWREVAERTGAGDVADLGVQVLGRNVEWWAAHRDRDGDNALECNGGLEAATPGSPRLGELWGEASDEAVPESSPRQPLNCVEAGAWVYAAALELGRLTEGDTALRWRSHASRRALEVEDGALGHWFEEGGLWQDYAKVGDAEDKERRLLVTRTHVAWAPLTVGIPREPTRVTRALEALLEPVVFTPAGVASVALDEPEARLRTDLRWQGALQPEVDWGALLALSRYGYEEEARSLRALLLARPLVAALEARSGQPVGPEGDAVAAAVRLLAAFHADEAEVLLLERGGPARKREGYLQRVFRAHDGQLLMEVDTGDARRLPRVRLEAQEQLFAQRPMSVALEDPQGRLEGREVRVRFPSFSLLEGTHLKADGSTVPVRLGEGEAWVALPGERLEVASMQFAGSTAGCGCGSTPAGLGAAVVLLLGLVRRRK